jgi:two-component system, sensor histidine kinase and response regulator
LKTVPAAELEKRRLAALRRYAVLDTPPEAAFDELTRLACQTCATAISLISLVDEGRQWFKSRVGFDRDETPREISFCSHAIEQDGLFIIEDLSRDDRFSANPLVTGDPKLRFYAGMPLSTPEGLKLGTLCVMDRHPRELSAEQTAALQILTRQVSTQLELRRHLADLARSVDEHKRTEERLRNSEAFYQTLVDTLPQNIFRKDTEGRFTFANKKFCHSVGKPLHEILGRTDFDFFPHELAAKYQRDDQRVIVTLDNLDTIEAHVTHDGSKLYVHVIKTALYDALGRVMGIQGIFWDVTQARTNEQALAYERDLLRGLLDNIPDRIYFKDVNSKFIRCSASMALRLGLKQPSEILGKTDFDFHPEEQAREFYADEQRIIVTGVPMIAKLERQTDTSGAEIWASVTKVPIFNQHGQVTGLIGISRDITQLKQAEFALQQARDAALETARIKTQFLANMSHEIRTPMNSIVGMTGLLLDTRLSQEQREFVATVRDSTETLLGIINEILDFSKIEAGKFTLEIIDFELRDAVESTVEMLAEHAQKKGLELVCWIEHDVPNLVRGDPGRVRQVLANLLSNAVKFTEKGEVILRIEKIAEDDRTVQLAFTVRDTGIGISPEAIAQIFRPFTQADGSTTRRYGGTGLGLSISKQLVELMKGEIGLESVPYKGSTFRFSLPLEKQPQAIVQETGYDPVAAQRLASLKVLIVDNSAMQRQVLRHQLGRFRISDVTEATGEDAISVLRSATAAGQPFGVIIVDLDLGEIDGLWLAQNITSNPAIAPARILAVTPLGRRLNPARMQALGVAGCTVKPVRQARLFECLVQIIGSSGPQSSTAGASETQIFQSSREAAARNVRVLVAEDNIVNQRLAVRQLRKLGYAAEAVASGREAWEAVQRVPYDVILLDCQMPELDGYEVTRRIREAEKNTELIKASPYIIALTANALYGDREKGLAAGMNDYLTKPLRLEDLELAMQRAVVKILPPRALKLSTEAQTVDPEIIAGLRNLREAGQPDPLGELIDLFLKDSRPRLQKMELAVGQRDNESLAAAAHAIKGSASNLGARRLASLCANLEKCAKADDQLEAANILLDIKGEFHQVEQSLAAELQS